MPCFRGSSRPRDLNLCLQRLLHYRWILCCRVSRKALCVCAHLHLFCACMCHADLILVMSVSIFQITRWLSLQSSALTLRLGEVTFCYLMQGQPASSGSWHGPLVAGDLGVLPIVPPSESFSICDALKSVAVSLRCGHSAGGTNQSFVPAFRHHCPPMERI